MKRRILSAGLLACLSVVWASASSSPEGLVVHEWGTFLSMSGSDGVSLDGMYHEEHALPPFVHARGTAQLKRPSSVVKGETPVIYFYTPERRRVHVEVGFPGGIWTQWYPQADLVIPGLTSSASSRGRDGRILWNVELVPAGTPGVTLPETQADALWNHARQVEASYVRGTDPTRAGSPAEWDRFIFYRGLGEAPLPLDVRPQDGRLSLAARADAVQHLYVIRVEGGRASYSYLPSLAPGASVTAAIPTLDTALPVERFAETIADDVARRLEESGLYDKEARAMVNTWRSSYFRTDGIRVLFVLPQSWTDRYIPLRITPPPDEVVRVMVGRIEVLTPDRERRAEAAVRDLASPDEQRRGRAFAILANEGRYVEPIVRRTLQASTDERVRGLSRRLLSTDFVTDLRTALTSASTGARVYEEPVYVRAQLASLLRDVGLPEQAQAEGKAALAVLERRPLPRMSDHNARHLLRGLARAHEGAGNDGMALKWYADFVRFGSQTRQCGGCHVLEGPRDMSFFRDWWAGRRFAAAAERTGQVASLIGSHESALAAKPRDPAAQLALAYLYERRGDDAKAQAMWKALERQEAAP